ncbi:MAG: cell division protein FtsL [Lactobacillus sp.]
MVDTSARRLEYDPEEAAGTRVTSIVQDYRQVSYNWRERALVIVASVVLLVLATICVSTSIAATAAEEHLTHVQQQMAKRETSVTGLNQQIGELTSNTRLNRIARQKGLSLIEKNIRTIR